MTGHAVATAQEAPPLRVAVGYAFLHDDYVDRNFPIGWAGSVERDVNRRLSIVGEGSGNYWHDERDPISFLPYSIFVHAMGVGLRVRPAPDRRTSVFAHTRSRLAAQNPHEPRQAIRAGARR